MDWKVGNLEKKNSSLILFKETFSNQDFQSHFQYKNHAAIYFFDRKFLGIILGKSR